MKYSQAVLVAVVGGAVLAAAAPAASSTSTSTAPAVKPTESPLTAPAAPLANVAQPKGTKPHQKVHHTAQDRTHPGQKHKSSRHPGGPKHKSSHTGEPKHKSGQHHPGDKHPKKHTGSEVKSTVAKSKPVTPDAAAVTKPSASGSATAPSVAGRDVEELFERSFDEHGIEARGMFDFFSAFRKKKDVHKHDGHHKHGQHHKNKEAHKEKEAHKPATPASTPSAAPSPAASTTPAESKGPANPAPQAEHVAPAPEGAQAPLAGREFLDEEDLFEREFEDDVFERDFNEDLEARFLGLGKLWNRIRGKKSAPTPPVDPSQPANQQQAVRSFDDEDIFQREIDEDLEARFVKKLWRAMRGKKRPAPSVDTTEQQERSFDEDDVFERDLYDEEDLFERDLYDEEDLFGRDIYDEEDLFEREYLDEEDLMAREADIMDGIQAAKNTFAHPHPRDFDDLLNLRGFEDFELEELD